MTLSRVCFLLLTFFYMIARFVPRRHVRASVRVYAYVIHIRAPPYVRDLTSLGRVERDRVAVGAVALLVEHVDGEPVLGERLEARHHSVTPVAGERHGVALVQGLIRIQQAPLPHPADLLEGRVMNGVEKKKEEGRRGRRRRERRWRLCGGEWFNSWFPL